ncbi:MAG: hypothetical protein HYV27_22955 [Candidatus Hydrogenedentes bacterium]|nr:hypothetical protein [Candidatus Hydrogenedentota bacterium]
MTMHRCGLTLFYSGLFLSVAIGAHAEPRVLLVGDSWAQGIEVANAFNEVVEEYGGALDTVFGALTAIGGTTLHHWASAEGKTHKNPVGGTESGLNAIKAALAQHASIDVAHLILGGNDILGFIAKEKPTDAAWTERKERIRADLNLLLDHLFAQPQIKAVVIEDYSYLNRDSAEELLGCLEPGKWSFGGMTQAEVSQYFVEAGKIKLDVARARKGCLYLQNFGRLQHHFGVPEKAPAPGGPAENYTPFPGGDINAPCPDAAFDPAQLGPCPKDGPSAGDGVHINEAAHKVLLRSAVDAFYRDWLKLAATPAG